MLFAHANHVVPTVLLTLNLTAPKVYWFPTGCAPYVPTFIWLISKMAA